MKCIKCKSNNINKANYCKECGYKFSEKEQKAAQRRTFVGKLEMIEEAYKICTLKVITDHILFKIASIVLLLVVGLMFYFNYGNEVKILNNSNYKIKYNSEYNEYYIFTKDDEVTLNLYIPNKVENLKIKKIENENTVEETEFKKDDKITLYTNLEEDYYLLESEISNVKLYVFRGDNNE